MTFLERSGADWGRFFSHSHSAWCRRLECCNLPEPAKQCKAEHFMWNKPCKVSAHESRNQTETRMPSASLRHLILQLSLCTPMHSCSKDEGDKGKEVLTILARIITNAEAATAELSRTSPVESVQQEVVPVAKRVHCFPFPSCFITSSGCVMILVMIYNDLHNFKFQYV